MSDNGVLHANGKILLTGEYLVMDGATALALPVNKGQTLTTEPAVGNLISWIASDSEGIWFKATYSLFDFSVIEATDTLIGSNLERLLKAAADINPSHPVTQGIKIRTHLNFNRLLGLGSSSTLIALIARLFDVDKFILHHNVSGGSGYDIACTDVNNPILYTRTETGARMREVNFNPAFSEHLYFIYLGNKQDTNAEIVNYNTLRKDDINKEIKLITELTYKVLEVKDLTTFTQLIETHEKILGTILKRNSIKQQQFSDFDGSIKSLGAWGGDFVLVSSGNDEEYVFNYFKKRNFNTIYHFKDLVLNNQVINDHDTSIRF